MAPTVVQRRGILLVPPVEHFTNSYWVCVGAADSVFHMAYKGSTSLDETAATVDSLVCLEWAWQNSARATCAGPAEKRSIQDGGQWADGDAAGYYRLIVVEQSWDARDGGAFLQWVQRQAAGSPEIVRETVAIPFARQLLIVEEAELWRDSAGRPPCVMVVGVTEAATFWTWKTPRERVAFVLGAPGQMRRIDHCASSR